MTVRDVKFDPDDPLASIADESEKQNKALRDYALLGVARSFSKLIERYKADTKAVQKYNANPKAWPADVPVPVLPPTVRTTTIKNWSQKYGWQARCARFDVIQGEIEKLEYAQIQTDMRRRRVQLLQGVFGKVVVAVQGLDPNKATWADVTNALKTVGSEMRIELGESGEEEKGAAGRQITTIVIEMPKSQ